MQTAIAYALMLVATAFTFPSTSANGRAWRPGFQASTVQPVGSSTASPVRSQTHAVVSGTVVDEDGDPIILNDVFGLAAESGVVRSTRLSATTDDRGRFVLDSVEPGTYVFGTLPKIRPERMRFDHFPDERRIVLTYFPAAATVAGAKTVDVRAGEVRDLTIKVLRAPVRRATGRVVTPTHPVGGLHLLLQRFDPLMMPASDGLLPTVRGLRTEMDGSFAFENLAPGEYVVTLIGPAKEIRPSQRFSVVDSDARGVELRISDDAMKSSALQRQLPVAAEAVDGGTDIQGTVRDAFSGRGLSDALITLTNPESGEEHWADSDASGRFLMTHVRAGQYRLTVDKPAYLLAALPPEAIVRDARITVEATGTRFLDVDLVRGGVLTGRVLGADGNPARNAGVNVRQVTAGNGVVSISDTLNGSHQAPLRAGGTDPDGRFRVFGLPAGDYILSTGADRATTLSSVGATQAMTIFHPSTADPVSAVRIRVELGVESGPADIRRVVVLLPDVTGVITENSSPARANFSLEMIRRDVQSAVTIQGSDEHGTGQVRFRGVAPGQYTIIVRTQNAGSRRFAMVDVTVGPDGLDGVQLPLQPMATFSGRIQIEGMKSFAGPPMRVSMHPIDMPVERAPFARNTQYVGDDGLFFVKGLIPGRYRVAVVPNSNTPLPWNNMSVRLADGTLLQSSEVELHGPVDVAGVVIMVGSRR